MAKDFVTSPTDYPKPKGNYKAGGGVFDGEPGFPKRTPSKSGVPEKTYDNEPVDLAGKDLVYRYPGKRTT